MARFRTRLALLGSAAALTAGALAPAQLAGAQAAAAAGEIQWVALGDSYTAGVIRAAGNTFEAPRDGCERTDRSYPQVIDRDLGGYFELTNVSCGAATIENVTDTLQNPIGRHLPPFSEDPDYPFPAVPPQSEAVGTDTGVITVGVGGNTLGFADLLTKCMELGGESNGNGTPCKDALSAGIPARLKQVRQDYDRMLTVLHERAPKAKILAVGYPTVIPEDAAKCSYGDLTKFGTITPGDLAWLRPGRPGTPQQDHRRLDRHTGRRLVRRPLRLLPQPQRLRRRQMGRRHRHPPRPTLLRPPQRPRPPQRRRPRRRSDAERDQLSSRTPAPSAPCSEPASGTSRRPVPWSANVVLPHQARPGTACSGPALPREPGASRTGVLAQVPCSSD
ncbi:SGNH/GDSL hydrolase family protein [Yinghuangia aomiensis]